jgi:PAS domain S-box-containing protein
MSADKITMNTDKKGFMDLLKPVNWSIKCKTMVNFLVRAVVAIGLLILLTNAIQRNITIREVNNNLVLLSDTKVNHLEDYFAHLNDRIRTFSSSRQTVDAFNQFTGTFMSIESDNYLPSSVEDYMRMNVLLESYYKTEVLPMLGIINNGASESGLKKLLPDDKKQRILQYLYIASNPKPFGMKGNTTKADDGSAYSYMHALYHPEIVMFSRQSGISDIIFADYATGYVTYSLKKNLDFATNLFEGPYRNSGLGMAFKSAVSQNEQGAVSYIDASIYTPALNKPQIFISTPVFNGSQLMGAIIFAIDNSLINNLLKFEKEGTNTHNSLKAVIIGDDLKYRSDDPDFVNNSKTYIKKLRRHAETGETAGYAEEFNSTSLVQHVDKESFAGALKKKPGIVKYKTETGETVFCSYRPLSIGNLNWTLLIQLDRSDAMASLNRFMFFLILIALVIAVILYYISGFLNNSITGRLEIVKENIFALNNGELAGITINDTNDEVGHISKGIHQLNERMKATAGFVNELSKGNLDVDFPVTGETDKFGISLNSIKQSLVLRKTDEDLRKKEDDIRNWTNQGVAMFNDIMRTDNNNLENLSLNIIRNLVQYLSANQGGLFLMEDGDEKQYLKLIAAYAFDRQKFLKKNVEIGEGMVGTCVLEKKSILTNKLPADYMTITSGLGGSKPKCLLVVPLKKDNDVLGVLEIASFEDLRNYEVEFVEKIAESIASALITVKLHLQTTQYLERFQQQAEEMKAQDEELRQNIEELQATHEQMERLKEEENEKNRKILKEMDDFRKLLISVINEVPEKIFLKDDQGRFVIANKPVAENYGKTVDEILGKSDFDFYPHDEAAKYFSNEQEIVKSGITQAYDEGDPSRYDGLIVRTIKKPFYIEHLGVTGLFGVQFDISDIKRKEFEANKLAEEIKESSEQLKTQEEELRQNLEEMHATQEDLLRQLDENEKMKISLSKEIALMDALMENVPESIYFKDKESKFIRFSNSMLKLFGLEKKEELLGKSDFDFFSEEHARPAFEGEQKIISTGKAIIDLEEKEVMPDGQFNWVNTTKMPLKDSNGNIIGTFGISKNISRIKNMEIQALDMSESVEKNRKLLIDILNKIPAKIFLKDQNGAFVIVNEAVSSIYNKTPEQIIGTTDFDNHPNEDVAGWRKQELDIVKTGEKSYLHIEKQNGHKRYLNTTKVPFILATTGEKGLLGIQVDVTDLKIMEEEVKRLLEENKRLRKSGN